jgi:hypothetical protein
MTMVPDFHEAEDLLQNVAVVSLRKLSEYDPKHPFMVFFAMGCFHRSPSCNMIMRSPSAWSLKGFPPT